MKPPRLCCPDVRERLQDLYDRGVDPTGPAGGPQLRDHLRRCERCRGFAGFLSGFPPALRQAVDQAIAARPPGGAANRNLRVRPAARPILRWGLAAAALLAVAGLALGTLERYLTARGMRGEVARLVEDVYAEPLLADVESALRRGRSGLSEYLEAYGAETLDWFEGSTGTGLPN